MTPTQTRKLKNREKYDLMKSLHFAHPFVDPWGCERRVLFGDEASWRIRPEIIHVGGPTQPQSLVLASAKPQQVTQLMPVPMWEISMIDPKSDHAVTWLVDLSGAHERSACRYIEETDEENERKINMVMGIAEYEQRMKKAAEEEREGRVEH